MDDTRGIPIDPEESTGAALARLRRASGLNGEEAGRRAGMSQAKVSRLETGKNRNPPDIGRLARALGASEALVNQLMNQAELAQHRPTDWRQTPLGLAKTQRVIAEREREVQIIRAFEPSVIHGLLQTGEYARSLLSVFQMQEEIILSSTPNPAASIAEALAVRISRQEVLSDPGKKFHFVLMEAVLDNNFCPPEDMLGQIRRLRDVSTQFDNVTLKIVPAEAKHLLPPLHGFEIFGDKAVAVDTFNAGLTSANEPDVRLYRRIFDSFEAHATAQIEPIIGKHQSHYLRQLS